MTADTAGSGGQPSPLWTPAGGRTATGALDLQRCRLVLAFHIQLGMGALPLWPLASLEHPRLVLGTRLPLESCLGSLAFVRYLLRLGTVAPGLRLRHRRGLHVARITGQRRLSFRAEPSPLHLLRLRLSPPSAPAPAPRADNDVTIVHNETKVVNNHITENNTTIINNGVPPELVEKRPANRFARFASARWILSWKASPASGRSMKTEDTGSLSSHRPHSPGFDTRRKTGQPAAGPQDRDA